MIPPQHGVREIAVVGEQQEPGVAVEPNRNLPETPLPPRPRCRTPRRQAHPTPLKSALIYLRSYWVDGPRTAISVVVMYRDVSVAQKSWPCRQEARDNGDDDGSRVRPPRASR
jgi:hypothetical protein